MATGYVLLDRPNPNATARGYPGFWGRPTMNYEPSAIVAHTTESFADIIGPDAGAENVANWFATNDVVASYHTLVDSDSTVNCLPAGLDGTTPHTAFHAAGVNSWTLGLSFALRADSWASLPAEWVTAILARGADVAAAWCTRWGIPPVRVTLAEAEAGSKGFMRHADTSPEDRTDPGADFPWDRFLAMVADRLDLGGATTPEPEPVPEDDTMPTHLLRVSAGPSTGVVFAAFASGAVRTIGGAELAYFRSSNPNLQVLEVVDLNEVFQLIWHAHPFALDVRRIADSLRPSTPTAPVAAP